MPLRDIRNLLSASSELAALREKTQRLQALQRAYVDCTPVEFAELTKASRVGYLKAGTLFLLADHPAVAAKLRQLLPRLLPLFRNCDAEITGIRVEMQPKSPASPPSHHAKKDPLPVDYIEKLRAASETITDPGLKSAVASLVRNRVKKT